MSPKISPQNTGSAGPKILNQFIQALARIPPDQIAGSEVWGGPTLPRLGEGFGFPVGVGPKVREKCDRHTQQVNFAVFIITINLLKILCICVGKMCFLRKGFNPLRWLACHCVYGTCFVNFGAEIVQALSV